MIRPSTLIRPRERVVIFRSLSKVIAKRLSSPLYVELGVKRADTSREIVAALNSERRPGCHYSVLGVDIDPRAQKCWMEKVRPYGQVHARFFLGSTEDAYFSMPGEAAWVFVDACHCQECAQWDIENWGKLVVPGGHLVVHDTTPRRRSYTKLFQHGGTRRFGVWEAVHESRFLKSGWNLIEEVDDVNGVTVFERRPIVQESPLAPVGRKEEPWQSN